MNTFSDLNDPLRLLRNLIRVGVVAEVDLETGTCRVNTGGNVTDWLHWLAPRAGRSRSWWAPSVGEQVLIFSLGGELDAGFVMPSIYSDDFPAPSASADAVHITFHDGAVIEYEPETGALLATGIKSATVSAAEKVAEAFPLDTPVLITNVLTAVGKAGKKGTLSASLLAIANQARPVVVVVRVKEGADEAATTSNIIGGTDATGMYTGMKALLSVYLGWAGEPLYDKGQFTVDEIEHHGAPDTLTIRARSADYRGSLNSRRDKTYHRTTLAEIVKEVAERNKLIPQLAEGFAAIPVSHIDQTQETDAKFITRLAELNGAVVAIKAGRLLFIRPGAAVTASGKAIPQITLTRGDGDGHTFSIADRDAYTGVTASWLHTKDPKQKQAKTSVKLKRKPKFKQLRALQHPAAPKVKHQAVKPLPKPVEEKEGEYLAGNEDNVFSMTTVFASKKAAMRAAQAKWNKLQRGVAEFSINLAKGRADLFPETPIAVKGFKSVIDAQPWIISKVTHSLSSSGYTTTLNLEVLLKDVTYEAVEDDNIEEV